MTATETNLNTLWPTERKALKESIPPEWRLPQDLLDNLPKDVRDIPRTCGILTAHEIEITEMDNPDLLLAQLASGNISSQTVTTAFLKRAAIAHQLVNCLTEFYPAEAMQEAKRLDDALKNTGKPVGPLHGLPISLKDQFDIEGRELTMGFASWLGECSQFRMAFSAKIQAYIFRPHFTKKLCLG